jgi:hypothetical protein
MRGIYIKAGKKKLKITNRYKQTEEEEMTGE